MAKTFTCTICNKEVTKRKSYAVVNGRACREHKEAQVAKDESQVKIKNSLKKAKKPKRSFGGERPESLSLKPRCFLCGEPGLQQDEWYLRWMVEQEKYEFVHGRVANIFDPKEMRQAVGKLADERCLFFVKWEGKNTKIKLDYHTYEMVKQFESLLGTAMLLVCGQCVDEKGFETEISKVGKKIEFDDLAKYAAVFDVLVKPVIQKMTVSELVQEN